jgi:hypothetical protein
MPNEKAGGFYHIGKNGANTISSDDLSISERFATGSS